MPTIFVTPTELGLMPIEREKRPKPPRLPSLGGMTEAGFNRVVAMITYHDFVPRHGFGAEAAWQEWRDSLPKTRKRARAQAAIRSCPDDISRFART